MLVGDKVVEERGWEKVDLKSEKMNVLSRIDLGWNNPS